MYFGMLLDHTIQTHFHQYSSHIAYTIYGLVYLGTAPRNEGSLRI